MSACGQNVRGGGTCALDEGHTGHHSTVTFGCDGCGRTLRGAAHEVVSVMAYGVQDDVLAYCFMCCIRPNGW